MSPGRLQRLPAAAPGWGVCLVKYVYVCLCVGGLFFFFFLFFLKSHGKFRGLASR